MLTRLVLRGARKILSDYLVEVPNAIKEALDDPRHETLKPSDPIFDNTDFQIVAKGALSLKAAEQQLVKSGINVINLGDGIVGEARDVAREHARLALETQKNMRDDQPIALLSGGELTVTITGAGKGGLIRNMRWPCAVPLKGPVASVLLRLIRTAVMAGADWPVIQLER